MKGMNFMFDPMDNEKAKRYIDNRIDGGYVIPMYVVCNGKRYGLDELDEITSFLPSALNVGFGGCTSPIERYPFPMNASYEVDVVNVFTEHDEVKNIEKKYIVFEATPFNKEGPMYEQINYYIEMLIERISEHVNEYKKELLKKFNEEYYN